MRQQTAEEFVFSGPCRETTSPVLKLVACASLMSYRFDTPSRPKVVVGAATKNMVRRRREALRRCAASHRPRFARGSHLALAAFMQSI